VLRSGAPGAPPADESRGEHALVSNHLRMRALTREEAEAYVRRERPLDCAGAYKSEGLGIALFEHMRGDDPTAIVGLPLITVARLLRRLGLDPILPAASPAEPAAPSGG
jgi:septum formation protein